MKNINTIAKINEVKILVFEEDKRFVPIKPICQLLGVAEEGQVKKIKGNPIYYGHTDLSYATGADGKQRRMFCLQYEYVFGWLLSINPKNVRVEAKANVIRRQKECYEIFLHNFKRN